MAVAETKIMAVAETKTVAVTETKTETKTVPKIDMDFILIFSKYSDIPVPIPIADMLEYYRHLLDPFFNFSHYFNSFLSAVTDIGSIQKFVELIENICSRIQTDLEKNKNFTRYIKTKYKSVHEKKYDNAFYSLKNCGKTFLSIDIKEANFTVLNNYDPTILCADSWNNFIKKYVDIDFIVNCKIIRQYILDKLLINKRAQDYYPDYIQKIKEITEPFNLPIASIYVDEIVFEISKDFDTKVIMELLDEKIPKTFNLTKFDLLQLGKTNYCVKVTDSNKVKFYNCPKKFIIQAIKIYNKEEITELDKMFLDKQMIK